MPSPEGPPTDSFPAGQYHANQPTPPRPAQEPIGPIQLTTLATRRAALQALGLTGTYLELALRYVAEDVGWLTHTETFEEVVGQFRERLPPCPPCPVLVRRLGESFERGASRGVEGRRERSGSGGGVVGPPSVTRRLGREQPVVERLGREAIALFGEVEEAPVEDDGEEWEEFPFARLG